MQGRDKSRIQNNRSFCKNTTERTRRAWPDKARSQSCFQLKAFNINSRCFIPIIFFATSWTIVRHCDLARAYWIQNGGHMSRSIPLASFGITFFLRLIGICVTVQNFIVMSWTIAKSAEIWRFIIFGICMLLGTTHSLVVCITVHDFVGIGRVLLKI